MGRMHGKYVWYESHAIDGMNAERPPVKDSHVHETSKDPEQIIHESGNRIRVMKWIGGRTLIVYYDETEHDIYVRGVSATKRRRA